MFECFNFECARYRFECCVYAFERYNNYIKRNDELDTILLLYDTFPFEINRRVAYHLLFNPTIVFVQQYWWVKNMKPLIIFSIIILTGVLIGASSATTATITVSTSTDLSGTADATQSTLTPTSSSITANGVSTQVLTVQAKD
ncbi:MAG TPA: Ig-like domain-containing protein, partial [Bacteroidota bacterium]|nr:Ig-like domain-containing protein [Bacteroidota bacterium]